ncbi:hypothetical protein D9Q98_006926 [Chlorella vulgaris]|uniref:Uncharacterized protein n=1 Tax=Chlorella vulgaris TaxID=3077 RepID=A0A9D4TJ45_CHLVU|nr:hypothetical protein D9Q98_006926 [Chlorella vulgaris]
MAACSSSFSSRLAPCSSRLRALQPAQRRAGGRRRGLAPAVAALDSMTVTAVSQQAIAFVAVLGGEAAYTGLSTDSSRPGRPTVPGTLLGVAGTLGATGLLQQEGLVGTVGCVVGVLSSAAMMTIMIQRTQQTPYNPNDWPGAKAWPAVMALISFFMLSGFFQALTAAVK